MGSDIKHPKASQAHIILINRTRKKKMMILFLTALPALTLGVTFEDMKRRYGGEKRHKENIVHFVESLELLHGGTTLMRECVQLHEMKTTDQKQTVMSILDDYKKIINKEDTRTAAESLFS